MRIATESPWHILDTHENGSGDLLTALLLARLDQYPNNLRRAVELATASLQGVVRQTYETAIRHIDPSDPPAKVAMWPFTATHLLVLPREHLQGGEACSVWDALFQLLPYLCWTRICRVGEACCMDSADLPHIIINCLYRSKGQSKGQGLLIYHSLEKGSVQYEIAPIIPSAMVSATCN